MQKLPEVERAKALMNEAASWSVMKWLREKKHVRKVADEANAALDHLDATIKATWSDDAKAAYKATIKAKSDSSAGSDSAIEPLVKAAKKADELAQQARMEAEKTFDEAERLLSTSMAREGCKKAITSWELREKAIMKAAALSSPGK